MILSDGGENLYLLIYFFFLYCRNLFWVYFLWPSFLFLIGNINYFVAALKFVFCLSLANKIRFLSRKEISRSGGSAGSKSNTSLDTCRCVVHLPLRCCWVHLAPHKFNSEWLGHIMGSLAMEPILEFLNMDHPNHPTRRKTTYKFIAIFHIYINFNWLKMYQKILYIVKIFWIYSTRGVITNKWMFTKRKITNSYICINICWMK